MASRRNIQAIAAAALATGSSVAAIVVDRARPEMSGAEQILAVMLVAVVLYFAYSLVETVLRRIYYRHVLGKWHYVTVARSGGNQNYGTMGIDFTDEGTLKYEVQLHRNPEELRREENARGRSVSEAMDYNARRRALHILYDVDLREDRDRRRGRLMLTAEGKDTLVGEWVSVRNETEISQGEMFAARPRDFPRKSQRWLDLRGFDR